MDGSNYVNDDDVWFDSPNHPGTKVYRKTLRLVVDEFFHEEYSKSSYKAMKSKLNGRNIYSGDPPQLCHSRELVNIFGDAFEKERTRRKEKQKGKALERKSRSQSSLVRKNKTSERVLGRKTSQSSLLSENSSSEITIERKSRLRSSLASENNISESALGRKSSSQSSLVSENSTPEITIERKSRLRSSLASENNISEGALACKSSSQSSLVRENDTSERAPGRKSPSQSSLVHENNTPERAFERKSRSQSSLVSENSTPEITIERKSRLRSSLASENNISEGALGCKSSSQSSLVRENDTSERASGRKSPSQSSLVHENNTPERALERKSRSQSSLVSENSTPEITLERKCRSQNSLLHENDTSERALGRKSRSRHLSDENTPVKSVRRNKSSRSQGSSHEYTSETSVGRNKSSSQSSLSSRDHARENSDDAEALHRSNLMGRSGEPPGRRGSMLNTSCDASREPLKESKLTSGGSKHPSKQDLQRRPDRSESPQGSADYANEKSRKLLKKSRNLLDRMEEAKETLSVNGDEDVYLDEEDRPGTQALKEVVKEAVSEFSQEEYSSSIFKWMRKELRGRRIFRTLDSQFVEASKKDLIYIFGDLYEYECKKFRKMKKAEKYMAQANKRDVYFDIPDFSGTKAWKRVVRHCAEANPDEIFCKELFTNIRLQLDGSSYYTGKPPKCLKARKQDILIRCGECFDDEKASIILSKDKISEGALCQRYRDSTKSETESSDATLICISGKRRPVPGYLYWILLRQMISDRLARWDWYQRTSHDICLRMATNSIVVRMQPYRMIIKKACRKDPESAGEDIFDRLAAAIEVKVFGRRWPFILLIGGLFAICVFSIIYAIGQKVLLGLL
jgi:hypothetical protein